MTGAGVSIDLLFCSSDPLPELKQVLGATPGSPFEIDYLAHLPAGYDRIVKLEITSGYLEGNALHADGRMVVTHVKNDSGERVNTQQRCALRAIHLRYMTGWVGTVVLEGTLKSSVI